MNSEFRDQFPSLKRKVNGQSCIFLDGPAGTQVPHLVIDSIAGYYRNSNSNTHGSFITTKETDQVISTTRQKVSDFLGAEGGHTISFGQNMTTLNFSLARAIGRYLNPGDEIVITQLDHESNRGPWLGLTDDGIIVREAKMTQSGELDYDDLKSKVNERTKLVAMGWASNLTGTINDVQLVRKLTYDVGAWLLLDAVHYAPHFSIDVQAVGADFLLCSAYKYYGPHVGLLYAKPGLLDRLPTDRLRTAYQHAPYSIETGTLNHAAITGVYAAIQFIENYGSGDSTTERIRSAFDHLMIHENKLAQDLYNGINGHNAIDILGTDFSAEPRAPTISFYHHQFNAKEICEFLAEQNIFAWSGHFYAQKAVEVLGLMEKGGVVRMGISAYTTKEDVEITLDVLDKMH